MSATSIGLVLIRPMIKTLTTATARLRLPGGRSAISRALLNKFGASGGGGGGSTHSGGSILATLRQSLNGRSSKPAYAVERAINVPKVGWGRVDRFHQAGTRSFGTQSRPSNRPLSTTTTTLSSHLRPRLSHRGPTTVSHVGLNPSPARQFSTSGASSSMRELGVNVPIGFRALAERLRSDEDRVEAMRKGRRSGRVMGGVKKVRKGGLEGGRWKGVRRGGMGSKVLAVNKDGKAKQSVVDAFNEYFPCAATTADATIEASALSTTTPTTTYIIIPLSSTLTPLFDSHPTPRHPPPHTHLFPPDPPKRPNLLSPAPTSPSPDPTTLLTALVDVGLLSSAGAESWVHHRADNAPGSAVEVIYMRGSMGGGYDQPEALRVVLAGRTEKVVRTLLSERSLRGVHVYQVETGSRRGRGRHPDVLSTTGSSFHSSGISSLSSITSSSALSSLTPSSVPTPPYDPIIDMERSAWRMPVLDFAADAGLTRSPCREEEAFDDAVWDSGEEQRAHRSRWDDEMDDELEGSGWSTPMCSDTSSLAVSEDMEEM